MARYDMWQLGVPGLQIHGPIVQDGTDPAIVVSLATRSEATYLIVQDSERAMDEVTDAFGLPRIDHEFALFAWRNGAWEKVRSWAIPPSLMDG